MEGILCYWPVIAFSLAGLVLYLLIFVLPRYVGAFVALLLFAVLSGVRLPERAEFVLVSKCLTLAIALTMGLAVGESLVHQGYHDYVAAALPQSSQEQIRAAVGLENMGLRQADCVAIVGEGYAEFWAHLAGLKIVGQIMPEEGGAEEFWNSSGERKKAVYKVLAGSGARALIAWSSSADLGPGWQQVPGTFYRVYFFRNY